MNVNRNADIADYITDFRYKLKSFPDADYITDLDFTSEAG